MLVPAARARLTLRIAPDDDPVAARQALVTHLEEHAPWGAQVTVTEGDRGEPTHIDATGPAYDAARAAFREAWDGTEPVDTGIGGSIPFIAAFREAFPDAAVLVTDHSAFPYELIHRAVPLIVDTRNAFRSRGMQGAHVVLA